jgi:geranylgeranyl pyrophosphate synthase
MGSPADIKKILKNRSQQVDHHIEKYVPREYREDSLLFKINPPGYKLDIEALNKTIAKPFWEFLDRGGKRWRPALFLLVCEALGGDPKEFLDFAVIPEVIHDGTLIADDIEDSSRFRRGTLCTYKLFGLDIAINLSSSMYFLPLLVLMEKREKISCGKARRVYEIYVQEMINLSLGQATDIAWHKGLTPPHEVSEQQYLQMCAYKTGTLARMAAKIAAVLSNAKEDAVNKIGRFAESVGVSFQIQDDILDLASEEFAKGKGGLGMDITEGKLSLMVVHTLRKADPSDGEELIRILSMHTNEEALRRRAISIFKKYGSIEYAKNFASEVVRKSWNEVDKIFQPSEAKEILRNLADYLVNRDI